MIKLEREMIYHSIMRKTPVIWLILLLVVSLVLSGCNRVPEDWGDPNPDYLNLIDTSTCWNGICPGQTTQKKAEQILQSLTIGGENQVEKTELNSDLILIFDVQRFKGSSVLIKFDDSKQIVESVTINVKGNNLTMEQVVDLLGEPQEVMVEINTGIGDAASTFPSYGMLYTDLGILVWSGIYGDGLSPETDEIVLHPELGVLDFTYVEKPKDYLLDFYLRLLPSAQRSVAKKELEEFFHMWPGFGNSVSSVLDYDDYVYRYR